MKSPAVAGVASDSCPYRGLVPYFEEDADYFFGRQADIDIIVANCLTTRITLFYGASGVGKSSVLYAGVVHQLRERARLNLAERSCPECIAIPFSSWRDNPIAGLQERIESIMRTLLPAAWAEKFPAPQPALVETLRAWSEVTDSDLVLLFDQFEEYFLYRDAHDSSLGDELIAVVNDPALRVNVLFSLREDALAQLDTFKSHIAALFDNCLRLEHLTETAAREAIEEPLKLYNARRSEGLPRITLEAGFVDQVIEEVRAGRVRPSTAGAGTVKASPNTAKDQLHVEAPYLQLVMLRLWREDAGGGLLRSVTLKNLGGAQQIVRTHLDSVMHQLPAPEQALAASVFRELVTPSGAKIAHYVDDLAAFAGAPPEKIGEMFHRLNESQSRVLRDVTPPGAASKRYEIFHDLLAAPILNWRQRFVAEQRQKKIIRRLATAGGVIALVLLPVFAAFTLAYVRRSNQVAVATKTTFLRHENEQLVAQISASEVVAEKETRGPGQSEQAAAGQPLPEADISGARDYTTNKIFRGHERDVWMASYGSFREQGFVPGMHGRYLITAGRDKTARIWDFLGDNDFPLIGHKDEVNAALINPAPRGDGSGWFAASASDDQTAGLWTAQRSQEPFLLAAHRAPLTGLAWSNNGDWLVTTSKDATALIWNVTGKPQAPAVTLNKHTASVWAPFLLENSEGAWLVTPSGDGTARLWTFPKGEACAFSDAAPADREVLRHGAPVRRAVMDAKARWILTAAADGRAVLWDRITGQNLCEAVHEKAVRDVAFNSDGNLFLTASADNTAQVWDAENRRPLVALKGHTAALFSAQFTRFGPGVVTTSWDQTARLWNYETKKCIAVLRGHTGVLWCVAFSPSGENFTTTSADGTGRLWELKQIPGGEAFLPPGQ